VTSSFKVAQVWGIPIRLHISLALVVILFMHRFGFVMGLLIETALVVSIVLHELGHSIVAIRKGCRVREITLLCIGGAAQMERIPTRPLDEFLMAVAGPLVSLALGGMCVAAGARLPLPKVDPYDMNALSMIGWINLGLVTFNLIPSFPMDGGRVLRSALTPRMGRLRATFVAARLGKIIAVLFGVHGYFTNNWFLVFIAFFVFISAGNEYQLVRQQESRQAPPETPWNAPDDAPPVPPPRDDTVTIGPPPYEEKGGESRTRIHRT
jgi:Zn-dependent protease